MVLKFCISMMFQKNSTEELGMYVEKEHGNKKGSREAKLCKTQKIVCRRKEHSSFYSFMLKQQKQADSVKTCLLPFMFLKCCA